MSNSLEHDLDEAKRRYHAAKQDVDRIRQQIAERDCPIKIGETVVYVRDGKEASGVVNSIGPALDLNDLSFNEIGAKTGWSVSGPKINKTTGELGKHGFSISSRDFNLENGKWVQQGRSIERALGLDPIKE